jgi:hypothetical protein
MKREVETDISIDFTHTILKWIHLQMGMSPIQGLEIRLWLKFSNPNYTTTMTTTYKSSSENPINDTQNL